MMRSTIYFALASVLVMGAVNTADASQHLVHSAAGEPGTLKWTKNAVVTRHGWAYPGDIHNGVIFITEKNFAVDSLINLYAVRLDTQETIWTAEVPGSIYHPATYDDGLVYVVTEGGSFQAHDSSDGSLSWAFKAQNQFWLVKPLIVGDAVIASCGDGNVYAKNKKTGLELWTFQLEKPSFSSPTYGEGNVYFGSDDKHLYAVNVETGIEAWKYTSSNVADIRSQPAYHNGVLYFASGAGYVNALHATTGALIWESQISQNPYQCGVVYDDGMVYTGTYTGKTFHALDALTGAEQWQFSDGGSIAGTPTIADGIVYHGTAAGFLYARDAKNGTEVWKYQTLRGIYYQQPQLSEGVVYIGDHHDNSKIYAINRAASAPEPTTNPTPGPTTNPTPGPTTNPTPGPTTNPTPGPTTNPTPGPTSQLDGLVDAIRGLSVMVKANSEELSEIKGLLNQTDQAPSCYGRRTQA